MATTTASPKKKSGLKDYTARRGTVTEDLLPHTRRYRKELPCQGAPVNCSILEDDSEANDDDQVNKTSHNGTAARKSSGGPVQFRVPLEPSYQTSMNASTTTTSSTTRHSPKLLMQPLEAAVANLPEKYFKNSNLQPCSSASATRRNATPGRSKSSDDFQFGGGERRGGKKKPVPKNIPQTMERIRSTLTENQDDDTDDQPMKRRSSSMPDMRQIELIQEWSQNRNAEDEEAKNAEEDDWLKLPPRVVARIAAAAESPLLQLKSNHGNKSSGSVVNPKEQLHDSSNHKRHNKKHYSIHSDAAVVMDPHQEGKDETDTEAEDDPETSTPPPVRTIRTEGSRRGLGQKKSRSQSPLRNNKGGNTLSKEPAHPANVGPLHYFNGMASLPYFSASCSNLGQSSSADLNASMTSFATQQTSATSSTNATKRRAFGNRGRQELPATTKFLGNSRIKRYVTAPGTNAEQPPPEDPFLNSTFSMPTKK